MEVATVGCIIRPNALGRVDLEAAVDAGEVGGSITISVVSRELMVVVMIARARGISIILVEENSRCCGIAA